MGCPVDEAILGELVALGIGSVGVEVKEGEGAIGGE